jgi:hypothetical protein
MTDSGRALETDDAIVLLLGAPGRTDRTRGRVEGITRLEKLLFLLEKETPAARWLKEPGDFVAHNFGPFSAKAYREIETLVAAGLVRDSEQITDNAEDSWELRNIIGTQPPDPYSTRNFELTDRGRRYYSKLLTLLPKEAEREVADLKRRFGTAPLRQLVRYVYERYPEFTEKSVIRDEVLGS